ncbi:MAG: hypothetical protein ACREXW_20940 [Gammaproteobacteria bacterium]
MLDGFTAIGRKLSFKADWFAAIIHQLLLTSLGAYSLDNLESPDAFLRTVLEQIEDLPEVEAEYRLKEAVKKGWAVVEANMQITERDNDKFVERLGNKVAQYYSSSIVMDAVIGAVSDFVSKSRIARAEFLNNRDTYFNLYSYATIESYLVDPLVYFYSDLDSSSLSTKPLNLNADDLVAQLEYPGGVYYSHRLQPSRFTMDGISMDRKVWINFARSAGGAVALLEEVDWLHPYIRVLAQGL